MGCSHSKKKTKEKRNEKRPSCDRDDSSELVLQKQLQKFQFQLQTLKEVLSTNGSTERAELLKGHAHEEMCALVTAILDQVTAETAADLKVLFEQRNKAASEQHDQHVTEIQEKHEQQLMELTHKFTTTEQQLQARVDSLSTELDVFERLKKRVEESSFKTDLRRNIKALGSPGAFWESEQESLVFVIEMKAEQTEELRKRLRQMDTLIQKNLSLEEQMVHVLQQNEDLNVRLENCQSLIQRLSAQTLELESAVEQQANLNKRLSEEKEQLIFKIRHRDSFPSMHLSAITPR